MDQITKRTSPMFSLDATDFLKGTIVSAIGSVVSFLIDSLSSGGFVIDLKKMGAGAAVAGLSYISKNYFSPSQTVIRITPPSPPGTAEEKTPVTKEQAKQAIDSATMPQPITQSAPPTQQGTNQQPPSY